MVEPSYQAGEHSSKVLTLHSLEPDEIFRPTQDMFFYINKAQPNIWLAEISWHMESPNAWEKVRGNHLAQLHPTAASILHSVTFLSPVIFHMHKILRWEPSYT